MLSIHPGHDLHGNPDKRLSQALVSLDGAERGRAGQWPGSKLADGIPDTVQNLEAIRLLAERVGGQD
jgi:hypothetical protein